MMSTPAVSTFKSTPEREEIRSGVVIPAEPRAEMTVV